MIYLIGGVARAGKSILCQQFAAELKIGWISTDMLMELLRLGNVPGIKKEWNATPEAITANAEWFFPFLERFVWGINSLAENYVIEGVDFLPTQVMRLSRQYLLHCVFLGNSRITLHSFDQFPGRSHGYSHLPEEQRQKIVRDILRWSEWIQQEAEQFDYPYIDMSNNFPQQLKEASSVLLAAHYIY